MNFICDQLYDWFSRARVEMCHFILDRKVQLFISPTSCLLPFPFLYTYLPSSHLTILILPSLLTLLETRNWSSVHNCWCSSLATFGAGSSSWPTATSPNSLTSTSTVAYMIKCATNLPHFRCCMPKK